MLALVVGASVINMLTLQQERDSARVPVLSKSPASSDVFARVDSEIWHRKQITLIWIEPAATGNNSGSRGLPVGMDKWPAPGCAVVSPALARMSESDPKLGEMFRCRTSLGSTGTVTGSQLFAYIRPSDPTGLGDIRSAFRFEDGEAVGTGPIRRLSRAGADSVVRDLPARWQAGTGLAGFVVAPAFLLLAVGLGSASATRDSRFRLLRSMGAPGRTVHVIAAFEALLLAVPTFLAVISAWYLIGPHIGRVPAFDLQIVPGDLRLAVSVLGSLLGVGIVSVVVLSSAAIWRRSASVVAEDVDETGLSRWAYLPIWLSGSLFIASGFTQGGASSGLRMLGSAIAVMGAPLLVPRLVRQFGRWLEASRWPLAWLSGKAVQRSPKRLARPFVGLASLIAVTLLGVGYLNAILTIDPIADPAPNETTTVSITWPTTVEPDLSQLESRLPADLVVPVASEHEHGHSTGDSEAEIHDHSDATGAEADDTAGSGNSGDAEPEAPGGLAVLDVRCSELRQVGLSRSCDPSDPYAVDALSKKALARELELPFSGEVTEVRLRSVDPGEVTNVAVLSIRDPANVEDDVRVAARTVLPGSRTTSIQNQALGPSNAAGWIMAGIVACPLVLLPSVLIAVVGRLTERRRPWQHMINLGLVPRRMASLDILLLATSWLAAVVVGLTVGSLAIWMMMDPGDRYPWLPMLGVVGAIAITAAATALIVLAAGVRDLVNPAD